jgi:hypothetical protein
MNESTEHNNRNESGTDHFKEKYPGTGYYRGTNHTSEYVQGESPDRRAAKNDILEPASTQSVKSERWEH